MCGIFGFKNFNIDIAKIREELYHRGPDDFEYVKIDNKVFTHNRLSIIDLTKYAAQPMLFNGNIITFNGEIYNYIELKDKYLKNVKLKSNSDTEILLRLIQQYGFEILNKLNGMFAFAYYDKDSKSVFLARDRYGIKPLYYYIGSNAFAFSSEDSVLLKVLNLPFELNETYISNLLIKGISDFDENSLIKNISSVCPGEYIEITDNNKVIKRKYYNYNDTYIDKSILKKKDNVVNYFEDLLTDAIKLRNRSDVPIALTLSGGIDSSVIYTLSKEKLNINYTLFTYSNTDKNLNEYEKAKKLASNYDDSIIKVEYNNKEFRENFEKSIIALNGPIWSADHAGYYQLYKEIHKNGYKVVIEGHGADELFGGYPFVFPFAAKQAIAQGKYILAFKIFRIYYESNRLANYKISPFKFFKNFFPVAERNKNIFNEVLDYLFRTRNLPINLRCWDRIPMANSIESRSPFLDYRIVEFVRALPIEYKINGIGNKALLREILKKYKKSFIYKNKIKQPFIASDMEFIKDNASFLKQYYNINKYSFDTLINSGEMYNTKAYKACSLGFLENYYKQL